MEKKTYLITEEWDEPVGGYKNDDFSYCHYNAYECNTGQEAEEIVEQMNKFSPYDYVDSSYYPTKEAFESHIKYLESKNASVNRCK